MASLHYVFGTMNSGKSSKLIQTAFNYEERGRSVLCILPAVDTRAKGKIKARVGVDRDAVVVDDSAENLGDTIDQWIYAKRNCGRQIGAVLVDEAQFLTRDQVEVLANVVDSYLVPVICYGLKSDFQGNLFPGSAALLSLANKFEEMKTICWCGKAAHMVARIDSEGKMVTEGSQIEVGGNDRYVSLCRTHWMVGVVQPRGVRG